MNYNLSSTWLFDKETKRLAKKYKSLKKDLVQFIGELKINPHSGIDLGNGLRKIRMRISDKNKGKSGGARIITFTVIVSAEEAKIHLICIYDKSERDTMSLDEIHLILKESGLRE